MIQHFSIFKNNHKEKDNQPDYKISAKITTPTTEEFKDIGAVFLKDASNGSKFFSCALQKEREYDGKTYDGYVIVTESEYKKMKQVYEDHLIKNKNPDYPTPTDLDIDLSDISF